MITLNTYSSTVYWELNDLRLESSDICANGFTDRSSSTSSLHDQTVRSMLQGICLLNHIKQLKTSRTLCTHTHTHSQTVCHDVWMPDVSTQQKNYESTNKTWHRLGAQKEQLSAEIPEWDANEHVYHILQEQTHPMSRNLSLAWKVIDTTYNQCMQYMGKIILSCDLFWDHLNVNSNISLTIFQDQLI